MLKFVIWVIEDILESRQTIIRYLKEHFEQTGDIEIELVQFADLETACEQFDSRRKPDLVCADLYYRRPGKYKDLDPRAVYAEFIGEGRFSKRGRLDLVERLTRKCGGECPIICTTYTKWFADHRDVKKRDAIEWKERITSRLNEIGVKTILEKQSWDEDKDRLFDIVKREILLKRTAKEEKK